ncbi:MAG: glycine zipper 2TM domain-containing protein [Burkholderiaceae bacterium]
MNTLNVRLSTLGLGLCLLFAGAASRAGEPVFEAGAAPVAPVAEAPQAPYGAGPAPNDPAAGHRPHVGKGAIIGGVIGALAARHFAGQGSDKTMATVLGALGGAFIGHQIEKHREAGRSGPALGGPVQPPDDATPRPPVYNGGSI